MYECQASYLSLAPPVSGAVGWALTPFSPISSLPFQDSTLNVTSISRVDGNFNKKDEVRPPVVDPRCFTLCVLIVSFIYIVPFVYFRVLEPRNTVVEKLYLHTTNERCGFYRQCSEAYPGQGVWYIKIG